MEIWFLSEDLGLSVTSLCDRDLKKQITSVRNLLAKCFRQRIHRQSHVYFKWVMESPWNYYWLASHAMTLEKEFNIRFGRVHKYYSEFQNFKVCLPPLIGKETLREFPNVHLVKYKGQSTASAHRLHYLTTRPRNSKWTKVTPPDWWQAAVNSVHSQGRPYSPNVVRQLGIGLGCANAVKRAKSECKVTGGGSMATSDE